MSLRIRDAKADDMAFIIDAWKRSYENAPAVRGCDREHYRAEMTRTIRRICGQVTVKVACDPTDEDQIVGFAAYTQVSSDAAELVYVYVKQAFRGSGHARALLADVPVTSYAFLSNNVRPRDGWRYTPRFTW